MLLRVKPMTEVNTQALTRDFYQRVKGATYGTPYDVVPTETGFDVRLDLADAQWFGILSASGLKKAFVQHVKVTGPKSYTVTDDSQTVEWTASGPSRSGSMERQLGRQIEFGAAKIWGIRPDGSIGPVADYQFNSEEGRQLIDLVGEQMGLKSQLPASAKGGLIVGAVTVGLIVLAGLVLLIMWLSGALG